MREVPPGVPPGDVILGVRPTDLEVPAEWNAGLPRLRVETQVVESLGSETNLIFAVDAPRVDTEATRAAIEAQAADDDQLPWRTIGRCSRPVCRDDHGSRRVTRSNWRCEPITFISSTRRAARICVSDHPL